jgi:hypothetical protein
MKKTAPLWDIFLNSKKLGNLGCEKINEGESQSPLLGGRKSNVESHSSMSIFQ